MLLEAFSKQFDKNSQGSEIIAVRQQLGAIKLKAEGRDVYNNKIAIERDLSWFIRHTVSQ